MSIVPFPTRAQDGCLTFLAVIMKFHTGDRLPMSLAEKVYDVLATRAQLFQGSIVRSKTNTVRKQTILKSLFLQNRNAFAF